MKVTVDDDQCRGHGVCVTICPEVFTLTDDGYAVASESEVPAEFEDAVRDAIDNCPEHAIKASNDEVSLSNSKES
jgi:ferredoxin